MRKIRVVALGVSAAVVLSAAQASAQFPAPPDPGAWVGTWGAAAAGPVPGTDNGYPNFSIRNVVHTSVGGRSARVTLSNAFGNSPLVIGHSSVAVAAQAGTADAKPGSVKELTFGKRATVTIPADAEVQSDSVDLAIPADSDLLVTTYVPTSSGPVTYHPAASQTSFFTRNGDHALDTAGTAYNETTAVWHYVTGVDVRGSGARGSVVTLGDSITDGVG